MSTFSELLNARMIELIMTRAELAKKSGIKPNLISDYCSGKRIPRDNNIYRLANALSCSAAYLKGIKSDKADIQEAYDKGLRSFDVKAFIDEQIAKQDRYVSIYIGEYGTSISVYPVTEEEGSH